MESFDEFANFNFDSLNVISYQELSGAENMAIDHFISASEDLKVTPLLRFYGWKPWCVSLGYHQSEKVINVSKIRNDGYDIVRRPTGGRAIFHARELTYSIIVPLESAQRHILYAWVHTLLADAFRSAGIAVSLSSGNRTMPHLRQAADDFPCFTRSAETEIQFQGCKVVGSAQKIYKNHILQHGSIMIGADHLALPEYLETDPQTKKMLFDELSDKTRCIDQISSSRWEPKALSVVVTKQLETNGTMSLNYLQLNDAFINQAIQFAANTLTIQ